MITYFELARQNWKKAWFNKSFRLNLMVGLVIMIALLILTSFFFKYIEDNPNGVILHDWVLNKLPSMDVSIPIVCFEVSVVTLLLVRSITSPILCITFLIAFLFILIFRIITIGLTQLDPPIGLVVLKDPIADVVYRSGFIKRDLFYSGHASILFLSSFCLSKRVDKYYVVSVAILVCILLLIQHVHYTIDIVCAPFFAFGCFSLSKKWLNFQSIISEI